MKKITLATLKSFINRNRDNLYINVLREFDGMQDCRVSQDKGFRKTAVLDFNKNTLGIFDLWVVGGSRNHFDAYDDGVFRGISCGNSCGACVVAIKKTVDQQLEALMDIINIVNKGDEAQAEIEKAIDFLLDGEDTIDKITKLEAHADEIYRTNWDFLQKAVNIIVDASGGKIDEKTAWIMMRERRGQIDDLLSRVGKVV